MGRLAILAFGMFAAFVGAIYGFGMGRLGWPPASTIEAGHRMLNPGLRPRSWVERHYQERVGYFRTLPGPADIVMLGDSHTELARWDEMLPGANLINRGISGDTCQGLLQRIDEVTSRKPKRVFVLCGTNDAGGGIPRESTGAAIAGIARALREAGAEVVLQSVPLTNSASWNSRIAALNQITRATAESLNLRYLDLNPFLAPDGILQADYTTDGVHLTGAGYRLWADQVQRELQR